MVTVAPEAKFEPVIVTEVPPAVGPEFGLIEVTVTPELDPVIVRMPAALVMDWPSGFVTVIVRGPTAAPPATEMFRVTCVGSVYVTLLTVTPPPLTVAAMRLAKPAPGSKKPEPDT